LGWLITDSIAVSRRHLLKITRVPESLFFALIQPVMFVLLFAFVFGGAIDVGSGGATGYREYLIPGILAQTVMFAVAGITVGITEDASKGIMDRFRSLPMRPGAVLTGHTLASLLQNILVITILSLTGLAVGWRINNGFADAALAYLMFAVFAYAITWVGAWIGLHMPNSEVAGTAGLAWIFPFTFASNIFTPVATMPTWLQPFVLWNPVSSLALAARQLFGNPTPLLGDSFPERYPVQLAFGYAFLLLAIFAPLAVRAFKTRNK
jgi:ABC transporter DrrB family efflux protein